MIAIQENKLTVFLRKISRLQYPEFLIFDYYLYEYI